MKTYFVISTDVKSALDNVTVYGMSDLEKTDIMRLLSAHLKYSGSIMFIDKLSIPEYDCAYPLNKVLSMLDNMILHREEVVKKYTFNVADSLKCSSHYVHITHESGHYIIDLSYPDLDFKELSRDRSAMIAENRRVGEIMRFLFKNDIDFEYCGSRAKIKIPEDWRNDLRLLIHGDCYYDYTFMINKRVWHTTSEIVEITPSF